jgi:hypothetical protein
MFELGKSEFIRYQKWAILVCIILLGIFGFVSKLKPFLEPSSEQIALTYLLFIGGSFAFGIIQMALHKRVNHWTYLIHRPIKTSQIYIGLCTAGIAIIFLGFGLPYLIMVTGIDAFGSSVVDTRHYLYVLFLLLTCTMSYLIGSLVVLNASWGVALLLLMLVLVLLPKADNDFTQFFPVILIVASLFYLNVKSFKPDLSRHLKQPFSLVLLAVPMSFALSFGIVLSSTVFYHIPRFIAGNHPDTNPVAGSYNYLWEYDAKEFPVYILENTDTVLANQMVRQAKLADEDWIDADIWTFPRKGQLYVNDKQYSLNHSGTNSVWQFSHDEMLLIGLHQTSGEPIGIVGRNGFVANYSEVEDSDLFKEVPFLLGEEYFMTKTSIFQVNFDEKLLEIRYQLQGDEYFIGIPQIKEHFVALATNKNILLFDPRSYKDEYIELTPDYVVPHPVATKFLYGLKSYRLADGYLLTYFNRHHFGYDKPGAEAYYVNLGGEITLVGSRKFTVYKHPAWIRHLKYITSPIIYASNNMLFHFLEKEETGYGYLSLSELRGINHPNHVNLIAIFLHVISVFGAILLSRKHKLSPSQIATWISLCAFLSLPALFSMLLLNPWKAERGSHSKESNEPIAELNQEPNQGPN